MVVIIIWNWKGRYVMFKLCSNICANTSFCYCGFLCLIPFVLQTVKMHNLLTFFLLVEQNLH